MKKNSVCKFIKYMEKKSAIENIICAINLKFFQNMHRDCRFIYSEVIYEGKGCTAIFTNPKQVQKVLCKLANHFYGEIGE